MAQKSKKTDSPELATSALAMTAATDREFSTSLPLANPAKILAKKPRKSGKKPSSKGF